MYITTVDALFFAWFSSLGNVTSYNYLANDALDLDVPQDYYLEWTMDMALDDVNTYDTALSFHSLCTEM
jgi:hypothetical protein